MYLLATAFVSSEIYRVHFIPSKHTWKKKSPWYRRSLEMLEHNCLDGLFLYILPYNDAWDIEFYPDM